MIWKDRNIYGLDHAAADKRFTGGLTYLGTFPYKHYTFPAAFYSVASPDRSKGHKDYMLLLGWSPNTHVSGLTTEEMELHRKIPCLCCQVCGEVIYSFHRHDMTTCSCGTCSIDGGASYNRYIGNPLKYKCYVYDIIDKTFEEQK